jgi:nucleoside-diphosphate-sugar epimerase
MLLNWQGEEALRRIGEQHRHVLVETYLRDRPYAEVAREFGVLPVPVPGAPVQAAARAVAALPTPSPLPPATEWVEALSHPAIMDASKARRELGWTPRYTCLEALRDTLRRGS